LNKNAIALLTKLFEKDDENIDIMLKAIEKQKASISSWHSFEGLEWSDFAGISPGTVSTMSAVGILNIQYRSNKYKSYRFVNTDEVEQFINNYKKYKFVKSTRPTDYQNFNTSTLFEDIVGFDDLKVWINRSLTSAHRVNILLTGPPGCAKTLFLMELSKMSGAEWITGGSSTKVGIEELLINKQPRILLIDEIDKMDSKDFSILLPLMEEGRFTVTKHHRIDTVHIDCRVFASCNNKNKLTKELLSRFMEFNIPKYSKEEYVNVCINILTKRYNVDKGLAIKIADTTYDNMGGDIRRAINVANLCKNETEVDSLIETWKKYNK